MQKTIYQVLNNIKKQNYIICIKLTHLKKCHIFPWLSFHQIYKLHAYDQYKMKDNIINVSKNINQTQQMLSHLPYNEITISVFFKWWFQYKSPFMFKDVQFNWIMLTLKFSILTPSYKNLNVIIHL